MLPPPPFPGSGRYRIHVHAEVVQYWSFSAVSVSSFVELKNSFVPSFVTHRDSRIEAVGITDVEASMQLLALNTQKFLLKTELFKRF